MTEKPAEAGIKLLTPGDSVERKGKKYFALDAPRGTALELQIIEECRRTGHSAVEDELAYGVVALAVPVFDQALRVVAALNSSSHSRRISKAKLVRERFAMLQSVSRQISADLAGVPGLSLSAYP